MLSLSDMQKEQLLYLKQNRTELERLRRQWRCVVDDVEHPSLSGGRNSRVVNNLRALLPDLASEKLEPHALHHSSSAGRAERSCNSSAGLLRTSVKDLGSVF